MHFIHYLLSRCWLFSNQLLHVIVIGKKLYKIILYDYDVQKWNTSPDDEHSMWVYADTSADGDTLVEWATHNNLTLIHDAKQRGTFHSARWKKDSSPDLCCQSLGIWMKLFKTYKHRLHSQLYSYLATLFGFCRNTAQRRKLVDAEKERILEVCAFDYIRPIAAKSVLLLLN